jgi:hypothetical protein
VTVDSCLVISEEASVVALGSVLVISEEASIVVWAGGLVLPVGASVMEIGGKLDLPEGASVVRAVAGYWAGFSRWGRGSVDVAGLFDMFWLRSVFGRDSRSNQAGVVRVHRQQG